MLAADLQLAHAGQLAHMGQLAHAGAAKSRCCDRERVVHRRRGHPRGGAARSPRSRKRRRPGPGRGGGRVDRQGIRRSVDLVGRLVGRPIMRLMRRPVVGGIIHGVNCRRPGRSRAGLGSIYVTSMPSGGAPSYRWRLPPGRRRPGGTLLRGGRGWNSHGKDFPSRPSGARWDAGQRW